MPAPSAPAATRAELIADTALALLAERGLRGLTHRAVDEAAGLPQGSTSNLARTRLALLEAAVRRLAVREAAVLGLDGPPPQETGPEAFAEAVTGALHHALTGHRALVLARCELALEAVRRPELRAVYDSIGGRMRGRIAAMLAAAGSPEPERHALTLIAWADGLMLNCAAGSYHSSVPGPEELRRSLTELLHGMLGRPGPVQAE
jgi:AcrR family transcriptional regulator